MQVKPLTLLYVWWSVMILRGEQLRERYLQYLFKLKKSIAYIEMILLEGKKKPRKFHKYFTIKNIYTHAYIYTCIWYICIIYFISYFVIISPAPVPEKGTIGGNTVIKQVRHFLLFKQNYPPPPQLVKLNKIFHKVLKTIWSWQDFNGLSRSTQG